MKKLIITYCLVCFCLTIHSQIPNIGEVTSFIKKTNSIEGETPSAKFQVKAYNNHIIRVRVTQNSAFNSVHYALMDSLPDNAQCSFSEQDTAIMLSTPNIQTIITIKPSFGVIFKNNNGETVNEDMRGKYFGTTFYGNKPTNYKITQKGERFVGLGEVLGNLDKRGMVFTLNNTDTYKYGDPRLSMYISIPFYIGIHNGLMYGLFFNNTYKSVFNFASSTPFTSVSMDGGDMDYFFIYDTSIDKILEHYATITGHTPLPPKWSMGFHQSRCSYYPQSQVENIAQTFRDKQIPLDCIVLDADYLHEYEPFRINTYRFPDIKGLAEKMSTMGIELTASVNPGIKIDSTYDAYLDAMKKDVFLKYADGTTFTSDIAPNTNNYIDYTNPRGREWWIDKMRFLADIGIHGYWNDMNEPALVASYMPDNILFDFEGRRANAPEAKNVFGMQMARSSYLSALKYNPDLRPFVYTRSAFAGIQRYAAVWSGDNTASDEGLLTSILLNNQMSLSGIPFCGPDLGGYIGDGSKDLFKRWIQVGIFSPFVRNHKEYFATANEPWAYGEEVEAISKTYINFRYRLMPYIYDKFYETSQTAMPITRSLCVNYPFDDKVYSIDNQYEFLFGDAFLVIPVTSKETTKKIYLPEGQWYDLFTDHSIDGKKEIRVDVPSYQIPVYVKASSIIPMQKITQSTKENPGDTLYLHIYAGKTPNTYVHYEDDGNSFAYKKNMYAKRTIQYDPDNKRITFSAKEGDFISPYKKIQIILHGFDYLKQIRCNNKVLSLHKANIPVLNPLDNLKDFYDKTIYNTAINSILQNEQHIFVVNNSNAIIEIDLE
ncbi:DUF5110 domain-containing protein [Dysgonomonas sp. Marseille-P4677]|uniref:glycoside hydrolase family 31 protein n=1 Tax=Dysgonomonas sp. Marseille-P4677 TaxID=2364790 RepID=UPI0019146CFE|nr:TIM-barrel domain-containing protein [Dysgonomonas sp. Marseille-P4677]MBK5720850.1 DUF5110 domain-containing protein [Dysgonomonas sp. Marseille-P4677]